MKPCDCKDMVDVNRMMEGGIAFSSYSIQIAPLYVYIEAGNCTLKLPMTMFKRFAEWYLEDQKVDTTFIEN